MTISNNTHSAHREKQKIRVFSILSVVFTLLAASFTAATEAFCPDGSSAQASILFCRDFETATESYPADAYFAREVIGDAAVGNGAIALRGYPGGSSNGYGGASWAPSDAVNTRYYFKFKDGYMLPVGENWNHGPGIQYSGVCQVSFRPDWTMTTPPNLEFFTTCGGTGEYKPLVTNRVNVTLRNNRWYLAEMQAIMNTPGQNNGIVRFWIDEELVLEYTNLYIRDTTNVQFNQGLIYNSYTHRGNPAWPQKMLFDNFVVSNGTYIGPAVEENQRGTADPLSPYPLYTTYEGFHGQRPGDDCFAVPGSLTGRGFEEVWRTGTNTLQSAITQGAYKNTCNSNPDKALRVDITATQPAGGIFYPVGTLIPSQIALHGSIYLPSANDYNQSFALAGLTKYDIDNSQGESSWGKYLALSVVNNQWALVQRNSGAQTVASTSGSVTYNTWHEFELIIHENNTVSLMIDRTWLFKYIAPPSSISWAWEETPGIIKDRRKAVFGVLHSNVTQPFTIYYDDIDLGGPSFWSCEGWHASSCPFPPTPPPTPPTSICEATGSANCYYIDPVNGNDANAGTFAAPWRSAENIKSTIYFSYRPAGYVALGPGDHIYIRSTGNLSTVLCEGSDSGPNTGCNHLLFINGISGTASAPVTITSYPGERAFIGNAGIREIATLPQNQYPSTGIYVAGITIRNSNYLTIRDLTVANVTGEGMSISDSRDITLRNVFVHDTASNEFGGNPAGILFTRVDRTLVESSVFADNFWNPVPTDGFMRGEGVQYFSGNNHTLRNNTFYQTKQAYKNGVAQGYGGCVMYKHASTIATGWFHAYNNTLTNCHDFAIDIATQNAYIHHNLIINGSDRALMSRNIAGTTCQANQLWEYNTVMNTPAFGFNPSPTNGCTGSLFPALPKNITFRNNIIVDNSTSYSWDRSFVSIGIYANDTFYTATLPELSINNNCYYNPNRAINFEFFSQNSGATNTLGAAYTFATWQAFGFDVNSINANPLFVNAAAGDFRLQSGSPCSTMGKYGTASVTPPVVTSPPRIVFFQENFESQTNFPLSNSAGQNWYDYSTARTLTTAQAAPGSTSSMEWRWTPGLVIPPGGTMRRLFNSSETLYLSYWVKHTPNWVGSNRAYHPHMFLFINDMESVWIGPAFTRSTLYVEHTLGKLYMTAQDGVNIDQSRINQNLIGITENRAVSGCNGNPETGLLVSCYNNGGTYWNGKTVPSTTTPFGDTAGANYKGDWQFIETYFQMNTVTNGIGNANGIMQAWIDGEIVTNRNDIMFRTGQYPDMAFNQFFMGPYIGDSSPVDQTMWIDNLTVANRREGMLAQTVRRIGDLDGNGVVNLNDVILIIQNFKRRMNYDEGADINSDGIVNIFDMVLLGRQWG